MSVNQLWKLILPFLPDGLVCLAVFQSLLPGAPRGLESLYHTLALAGGEDKNFAQVLHWLAAARGEALLAGRLERESPHAWVGELVWEKNSLSPESWDALVKHAVQRTQPPVLKNAIPFYQPISALELPLQADKSARRDNYAGRSDHHDPLRHDVLHTHPLRDALELDRPLWSELLLDWELNEHPHSRNRFLRDWQPAAARLGGACFSFDSGFEALKHLLEDSPVMYRDVFAWLEVGEPEDAGKRLPYRVGWAPLFSALNGERNPTDPRLLFNRLSFGGLNLQADVPGSRDASILPDRVWALILLADALQRCPWPAFSVPSIWQAATFIGLAAAFVRSAYLYALDRVSPENGLPLSSVQQCFLRVLDDGDSRLLVEEGDESVQELEEEGLLRALGALFGDGLAETDGLAFPPVSYSYQDAGGEAATQDEAEYLQFRWGEAAALAQALVNYLHSPAYLAVVELVQPLVARCRKKPQ